jgi:hypothetical protein
VPATLVVPPTWPPPRLRPWVRRVAWSSFFPLLSPVLFRSASWCTHNRRYFTIIKHRCPSWRNPFTCANHKRPKRRSSFASAWIGID